MTKKKAPQLFKCTYNIIYNIRIHICICIYMEWICIHIYTITCLSLYLYVSFVSFIPWCAGDLRSLAWQWGVATKCEAYNSCVLLLFGWCIFIDVDTLQAGSLAASSSCYRQSGREKMLIHLNCCDMNSTCFFVWLMDWLADWRVGWLIVLLFDWLMIYWCYCLYMFCFDSVLYASWMLHLLEPPAWIYWTE